ncbi:MAG: hypothetical protein ABIH72_00450 [archaeon]
MLDKIREIVNQYYSNHKKFALVCLTTFCLGMAANAEYGSRLAIREDEVRRKAYSYFLQEQIGREETRVEEFEKMRNFMIGYNAHLNEQEGREKTELEEVSNMDEILKIKREIS